MKKVLALVLVIVIAAGMLMACAAPAPVESKPAESKPAESAPVASSAAPVESKPAEQSNLEKSLAIDVTTLKSSDGQPLFPKVEKKEIPPRPADPNALPETDAMHWYDMEFAGWMEQTKTIPESPKDGCIGKKVIFIINGDHPYLTAYCKAATVTGNAFQMDLQIMTPNWDINVQNQLIDQAINAKPDMIILVPLDSKAAVQQFRKINQAGIPLIAVSQLPDPEGFKYLVSYSGADDWGQFRMLAQALAKKMDYKGGICYIQHAPGGSPYFARTYAPMTELAKIAPDIKTLDMQAPGFEAEKTKQVVADWITRFGKDLTAICAADDSTQAIGAIEACKEAGRTDIVIIAAGNSKVGMDYVKSGELYAITYQSAETDGALPVKAAADWFNGKTVEPIIYLGKHVITQADVDSYMPAQW